MVGCSCVVVKDYGKESQVRKILDIIPRRGQKAFDFFHQILVDTEQQELANILTTQVS